MTTQSVTRPDIPLNKGFEKIRQNVNYVEQHDSSFESGLFNWRKGTIDDARLSNLRDRALFDEKAQNRMLQPTIGQGILFPDALNAITKEQSRLRTKPTTFRGVKQIIGDDKLGFATFRHNPLANMGDGKAWLNRDKEGMPFHGFPNKDYFSVNLKAIKSQDDNIYDISQIRDALEADVGSTQTFEESLKKFSHGAVTRPTNVHSFANNGPYLSEELGGLRGRPEGLAETFRKAEMQYQPTLDLTMHETDPKNRPMRVDMSLGSLYQAKSNQMAQTIRARQRKIDESTSSIVYDNNRSIIRKV